LLLLSISRLAFAGSSDRRVRTAIDFRGNWTWEELYAIPDVDTARVSWLKHNLSAAEAREVFALIAALSKPAAAQALPSNFYFDGRVLASSARLLMDSLSVRGPDGDAGAVRLAYLLGSYRRRVFESYKNSGYQLSFGSGTNAVPAYIDRGRAMTRGFDLSFDFGPFDTLMVIVSTPDITAAQILPRISTHAFDALIDHHSQTFYPIPLSRELLALNLSHAASDAALDRLYAFAAPQGLLHYTDLRSNAAGFRAMTGALKAREQDILAYVANTISKYVAPDTKLSRRVSFYVADWSDGWGADDVTAVDIEYYKGDIDRLVNTLLHETFHATQHAIQLAHPTPALILRTAADSALAQAADQILVEGTANFIAPTIKRSPESAAMMADSGTVLMRQLVALSAKPGAYDRKAAQAIIDLGVSGGGPFYWLGAAMAKTIADRSGPRAIGKAFEGDGIDFIETYAKTTRRSATGSRLIPPEVFSAVTALARIQP
jgi:hypothetical protein